MFFDENNNLFEITNEDNYNIDKYIDKTNYTNVNVGNIIFNRHNDSITNVVEGFNRGNMFDNLYNQYKNYNYKLNVNSKRDELLYKIQIYNFAIRDINLYLDLHPTESNMLNMFLKYNQELEVLKKEFTSLYSPLSINEVKNNNKWTWINNPWPWDKGGNI